MQPLLRAALAASALAALTRTAEWAQPADRTVTIVQSAADSSAELTSACPPGTLPDARACVPVPPTGLSDDAARPGSRPLPEPTDASRTIPRLPDRPSDTSRYAWPVAATSSRSHPDRPGILLSAPAGSPVRAVSLEGQVGETQIAQVTELVGVTVVTRHQIREGSVLREVLLVLGQLGQLATPVKRGATFPAAYELGRLPTGDGDAELYLEVRRAREGTDARALDTSEILTDAHTVGCDPRNVFPLKPR